MPQLSLDLQIEPKNNGFLVGDCNIEAYLMITKHNNPGVLYLYGEKYCGKSHLGNIWHSKTNAYRLVSNDFYGDKIFDKMHICESFLIDNTQIENHESSMLHFYNHVIGNNKKMLIIQNKSPWDLKLVTRDLKTRLRSCISTKINKMTNDLCKKVVEKILKEYGIIISKESADYIADNTEKNFKEVTKIAKRIGSKAIMTNNNITTYFLKNFL